MKKESILKYLIIFLIFAGFLIFLYFAQGKITGFVVLGDVGGIFFDGFESGSFATNKWTTSGAGTPWYIDTYNPYAGTYHAMVKPTGSESIVEINISTINYNTINFSFYAQTGGLDAGEYIAADWYNGTAWINVLNQEDIFPYAFYSYSLPGLASNNSNFKIRFRCLGNLNNEVCQLDNVQVSGNILGGDTIPPTITINIPSNNTFISNTLQDVNFTVADSNLNTCWYSNDTMTANTTLANCNTNITTLTWVDGQHNVTIWVNDSANNVNSSRVDFTIDTIKPTWSANETNLTPSTLNGKGVYFNITLTDTNSNTYIFSWYNGTAWENTTSSYTNAQEVSLTKTINVDVATINWTWYINDSANNLNQTSVWSVALLSDDNVPPNISFANPTTNASNLSQNFIFANLSFADPNINLGAIYLFNSTKNQINYTQSTTSTLEINFTGLADGIYYLNATINDTAGNKNQTETRIIVLDTTASNLTINSPSAITYTTSTILFNATAIDSTTLVNSCWYTINSGETNQTLSRDGLTNFYNFTQTSIVDSSYTARFYCNDSVNNINNTENVLFTVSIPEVSSSSGGGGGRGRGNSNSSKNFNSSVTEVFENNKTLDIQNFSKIEISLVDINRVEGFVNAEYIMKNLAEEDQDVELYFSVLDLKENIKSETAEVHFIPANSEKTFGTSISIDKNLKEELILIIDFKKYSSVSESAPIRSRVSGLSILNIEDNNKKNLFLILLFLLFFILVFFVLYKIIKNRKKH